MANIYKAGRGFWVYQNFRLLLKPHQSRWQCNPLLTCIDSRLFCSSAPLRQGSAQVFHRHGLPVLSVPLPSRREQCEFTLKPFGHTFGDFVDHLKAEDLGVDRVSAYSEDGARIAKSTPISVLLLNNFELVINDDKFFVESSPTVTVSHDDEQQISDVKRQVAELYTVMNIEEYQISREKELLEKLEQIQLELEPYEKIKKDLEEIAKKRNNRLSWVGLGLMSLQFGILARLTWWEYSWDIMEPVTYFITYGTTMAMFAYYVVTKQDYNFPEVRDREYLLTLYKRGRKANMDFARYNMLREDLHQTKYDLERLRDPLTLHLPLKHPDKQREKDADPERQ